MKAGLIQMYKKLILLLTILSLHLFALETLTPTKVFKSSGTVQSIVFKDDILYAGTSNGVVELFDTKTTKKIKEIKIPDIKDFMGDTIAAKIYSIDLLDNKLLIVSQGMKGYRNIYLYEKGKLTKVLGIDKKYFIQKADFISDNKIVFALLSNQIGVYNLQTKSLKYLIQVSPSAFSHFMLNEDKTKMATTDESGVVRILDVNSGRVIQQLKALNLDKVYQVDYKNGVVLTAGQDRQAVVYKNNLTHSFRYHFLLYSCGLSPKGDLGAIAYDEQNDVLVVDLNTYQELFKLTGQKSTLTQILFINEKELFTSSDDSNINYFKLTKE